MSPCDPGPSKVFKSSSTAISRVLIALHRSPAWISSLQGSSSFLAWCRVGDTYPTQHLDVSVRAYVYRWQPSRKPAACGIPNVRLPHTLQEGAIGFDFVCWSRRKR